MITAFLSIGLNLVVADAHAGQTCSQQPMQTAAMQSGLALAAKLQSALDASGAEVAVVGRVGEDVRRYGLRYTHAGLVYRNKPQAPWTVLHKLNRCGTDHSALYRQGLGNFFLDTPFEYRSLLITLKPEPAGRVLAAIRAGLQTRVDEPRYSLLAYPFATTFQNSNGWLLEFLAAANTPAALDGRAAVQAQLRRSGYRPDQIPVGMLERVGAGLTRANVSFLDHPLAERLAGEYSTVTVESLERWLDAQHWIAQRQELTL